MLLKTDNIAGTDVEVHVTGNGRFNVKRADDEHVLLGIDATMEDALAKARTTLAKRKVRVNVPFRTLDGEHGLATGLHGGTGRVMARLDGEACQMDNATLAKALRADTPQDVIDRYIELTNTVRAAQTEQRTIQRDHSLALEQAVKDAVDAALAPEAAA
jgi:hypothetical protein